MKTFNEFNESINESAADTVHTITITKHRDGRTRESTGTLSELIKAHSYTLDTGRSYQHEKGNKKINTNPMTVKDLVKHLNNAVNNSAADGYAGITYEHKVT